MLTFENLPKQVETLTIEVKNLQSLIENLKITVPQVEERLSRKGLAEHLGVTLTTIHNYKKRGAIPYYQTGRTVYFIKHEVEKALSSDRKTKKP
jgi:excisionase family DNA binding protein